MLVSHISTVEGEILCTRAKFLQSEYVFVIAGNYKCGEPSCGTRTQQLSVNQRCTNGTCKGKLEGEISERKANDTLRYLQGLFDVDKFVAEHPRKPN